MQGARWPRTEESVPVWLHDAPRHRPPTAFLVKRNCTGPDAGQLCRAGGLFGARVALGHPWLGGVGMCSVVHPPHRLPPNSSRLGLQLKATECLAVRLGQTLSDSRTTLPPRQLEYLAPYRCVLFV